MRPLRIRFWRAALAVLLVAVLMAGNADAATLTIGGFDSSRVFRPFSGADYSNLRSTLTDPANFSATGIAPFSVSFAPDINLATAESLAGFDVFVMTDVNTAFSSAEATAIQDFVRNGGCLVILTDTLHQSMPYGMDGSFAGNAVLSGLGGGSIDSTDTVGQGGLAGNQTATAGSFVNLGLSAVLSGPFGTFTSIDHFGATFHNALTAGPNSQLIGVRDSLGILMEIPHGALGDGSGGVLVSGDFLFGNPLIPPGLAALENNNNAIIFQNFLAQCGDERLLLPEPTSLSLLFLGGIFMSAAAYHRRKTSTQIRGHEAIKQQTPLE